jgi:hypothetical protein
MSRGSGSGFAFLVGACFALVAPNIAMDLGMSEGWATVVGVAGCFAVMLTVAAIVTVLTPPSR